MNNVIGRIRDFSGGEHARRAELYATLSREGQSPRALVISCADSRIVPEHILAAAPGDVFVCRTAGNFVPPAATDADGVVATIEYAVAALGIRDIVVCGHSDCGAMKGLAGDPAKLATMPAVAGWLRHGAAARQVVDACHPDLEGDARVRALTLENVVAQLATLRTHPAVAGGIARGEITLHGWFVDIGAGEVLALDGETGGFVAVRDGVLPVALAAAPAALLEAVE